MDPTDRRLVVACVLAPLAWTLHLLFIYGLSYATRRGSSLTVLLLVTLATLALALSSIVLARVPTGTPGVEGSEGPPPERVLRLRFLSLSATVLGVFFGLVIVAQAAPIVVFALEGP